MEWCFLASSSRKKQAEIIRAKTSQNLIINNTAKPDLLQNSVIELSHSQVQGEESKPDDKQEHPYLFSTAKLITI